MAVDLNDDNSLNEKAVNFWEKNKKNIAYVFIIFIAVYLSSNFYFSNQNKSLFLASEIYQKIQVDFQNKDIKIYVTELKNKYPSSPYAGRSSLILAQSFYNNNIDAALDEYDWAIINSKEKSIQSLALYSKARLYLLKNELDLAEITVNDINSKGFDGLKNYLLGDIYSLKKDNLKAKGFYDLALNFYSNKNDLSKVIKTKIDAIGN
ncbi:MAG: tetratricopeptide repeat protein [Proteobacteria bacterium]|nr:tetratricopeptide repeat protein [Pseudomonadota bacterium]